MTLIKVKQPTANGYLYNNWMDNVLNDLTRSFESSAPSQTTKPQVNIAESQDAYILELSAPGRTKEDFKINIDKNLLTVSYEKKEAQNNPEVKNAEVRYIKQEFNIQPFKRTFTLDDKVDHDNIKVKYENGLLKFHLPKKVNLATGSKTIEVE